MYRLKVELLLSFETAEARDNRYDQVKGMVAAIEAEKRGKVQKWDDVETTRPVITRANVEQETF